MEPNPEAFGRVVMLYVDFKINRIDGMKAFVDSGAQSTIISKKCAERCGLMHLLDTQFQGVAHGVGTAKILGRTHLLLMTIGNEVFEITFEVLDELNGTFDILLGLDMLRKHQAFIDISENQLRIGGTTVPFLDEKDFTAAMFGHTEQDQEKKQAKSRTSKEQSEAQDQNQRK